MKVKMLLRGPLKKYGKDAHVFEIHLERANSTARDTLEQLNIPLSAVSFILINGEKKNLETTLEGGEEVTVNPKVAGG